MIRTLGGIMVATLLAAAAHAQTDHLECFKVKDSNHKAAYTTRVGGLAPAQGCVIRVPAQLMCVPTAQPQMSPYPPGAPGGADAGAFLCYNVRCRRNALVATTVTDEFGQRLVRPRRSRLLCAPVTPSTTTSTTLPGGEVSTTTTTTCVCANTTTTTSGHHGTTSTTTTLPGAQCFAPNTKCGNCGNGACQNLRPSGELICAFQECFGTCQSTADCSDGRVCVGTSNVGLCCSPCS